MFVISYICGIFITLTAFNLFVSQYNFTKTILSMKTIYLSALLLISSITAQAQSSRFPNAAPQSGVITKKAAANRAAATTNTTTPSAATPTTPHAHHQCGQDATLNYMRSINPNYDAELRQLQRGIEMAAMQDNSAARSPQAVIEIPVVFHVIHNGEAIGTGRNISLARINAQLALLNSDIRKLNGNFNSGTPNVFKAYFYICGSRFEDRKSVV